MSEVTNRYWYPDQKIPDTAVNIQRPSVFGNPFKRGDLKIAAYAVAEYWIYIFSQMKRDTRFTSDCMALLGKDLVCSCKNKHHWKPCHGDPLLFLIERNAQTEWKNGEPIRCTLGAEELCNEYYRKCMHNTNGNIRYEFGLEEVNTTVKWYISDLKEEKRFKNAAFFYALWATLLMYIYNEGREMTDETVSYGLDWLWYYLGKGEPPQIHKRQSSTRYRRSGSTTEVL